jgi:hypothetical protein
MFKALRTLAYLVFLELLLICYSLSPPCIWEKSMQQDKMTN